MFYQLGVDLLTFLNQAFVIVGMALLVVGVATVVLAKRLTRVGRKTNDVSDDDKMLKTFRVLGLLILLAGFVVIAVGIIVIIA